MHVEVNDAVVRLYLHYMPNHAPIWTQMESRRLDCQRCRLKSARLQLSCEFCINNNAALRGGYHS